MDRHAARFGKNRRRSHHGVVVQHRLTHAHEHDASDGKFGVGLDLDHLVHHFPRGEVSPEAHPAGGAECAAQRATDLRADAHDVLPVVGPVHDRDTHGLEQVTVLATEQVLGETVRRRNGLLDPLEIRDVRQFPDAIKDRGGKAGLRVGPFAAAQDRGLNLARRARLQTGLRQGRAQALRGEILQ